MRSGKLRHKIEIKLLANNKDSSGRNVKSYVHQFNMRCNVHVLSGSELIKSGIGLSKEYVSVMARGDKRLKHDHFFDWENKTYSVESIKPDDDNLGMIVTGSREIK